MEWDAFTLCRINENGTYGENLFVNPDADVDASGNLTGWGKYVDNFTMTSSDNSPKLGGATIIATNRNHRCSTPSQEMKDVVAANGLGTYYVGAYVRFLEKPDKPVTVDLGAQVLGDSMAWPMASKKVVINDTEWHLVGGNISITQTGITSVTTFGEILYEGQAGDAGAYLGDMEWDAFMFCRVDGNGNLGKNLYANPNANIDANGEISGWGKNQQLTMTSSILPKQEDGALRATERSSITSGQSQDIGAALLNAGNGTYLYSGYVRFTEKPTTAQSFNLGIELRDAVGNGVGWPQVSATIGDTEWHKVSGTVSINANFAASSTFINTAQEYGIELDGMFLAKQGADGLYSENLFKNPTMECDDQGVTYDWTTYRVATLTNTAYEEELLPDGGVENSDGSVTYAKGIVPATDKNIVYSGRWYDVDGVKQVAFEGYVEIKFTGTSIRILTPASGNAYAEVDGKLSHKLHALASGEYIINGLTEGEHTLKLFAQAQQSRFKISGFRLDKGAKTLPIEDAKKIEFIGDSISEGYVDSRDKLSDLETNSYLNSFTLKTGRKLNEKYGWSYNTVAFGGSGIVLEGSPDPLTMGERYFTAREYLSSDGTDKTAALQAAGTLEATKYVPDYIVINMGTNDSGKDNKTFINNYVSFVTKLREAYPNVTVFCMTPFNGSKAAQVKEAVKAFDNGVYLIDSAKWGITGGADGLHPAPASLDTAADKLFEVIKAYVDNGTSPEPEQVAVKKVENGNAENGITNWGNIHGGSVELVQPGANNTGNAVKATISGKYQSIAFDLGPAILQDAENGYAGAGAGTYTVKFWAKAEAGHEGKYVMVLNSVCHLSAQNIKDLNLGLENTEDTYMSGQMIELTDEWKEYEIQFDVTETYVNEMYALYKSSHALASSAYQLVLRFDGSQPGCAYEGDQYFGYYVDEITVEAPDPNAPVKVPTGVVFEATDDNTLAYYITATTGGAVSAADVNDGEVTKQLIVQNLSDEDMSIQFSLQALVEVGGSASWTAPDESTTETFEIPAGEYETLEFTFAVNDDGTVTIKGVDVPIEKLFYRFNFTPSEFVEGAKFVVYGDETQVALFNAGTKTGWSKTLTYDAAPGQNNGEGTGDFAPVALIATVAVAFVALTVVVAKKRQD